MRQKIISLMLCLFLSVSAVPCHAATYDEISDSLRQKTALLQNERFTFGDEWLVIDLARAGSLSRSQAQDYVDNLKAYLQKTDGILSAKKYTEYSRTILALSALGLDASSIAGYNLLMPLADYEKVCSQGINGPIFALLALDSRNYPVPQNPAVQTQATRELYLTCILNAQTADGGWNLAADSTKAADVDLTAMAVQALAKYQSRPEAASAVKKALNYLLAAQNTHGSYSSDGTVNCESTAQVIIALGELNLDAQNTSCNKPKANMVDALLAYSAADGFKHQLNAEAADSLATEQALLALVSLKRQQEQTTSLYRMHDAPNLLSAAESAPTNSAVHIPAVHKTVNFSDISASPYNEAIGALAARGMVSGRGDNKFYPHATITRAEFAAILTKTLGLSETTALPFNDVDKSSWYYPAIQTAYKYQLIAGVSSHAFNPDGTLTRQEAAVMISRAARLCGLETAYSMREAQNILCVYSDYRACASWSTEALAWAYDKHILDDTVWKINPSENISRGEVAQMLYNMLILAELI